MSHTLKVARRGAINLINRQARLAAAVVATVVLGACAAEGGPTGNNVAPPPAAPTAGWLTLQVGTPRSDDGAVQFAITGPGVDSARIVGYDGFATVASTGADIVVTGNISNGTVAQIHVPNLARSTEYSATVVAAAARDTYAMQNLAGYRALLVR